MFYVDANLFIDASCEEGDAGINARHFLRTLRTDAPAYTSYLTLDEVSYRALRIKGKEVAVGAVSLMLAHPHLRFIEVDEEIALEAMRIFAEEGLKPRDAFHAASMRARGITTIVSGDSDFDHVKGIRRIDLATLKE